MAFSTIAAIATPLGSGGIGIIKISGKKSLEIASALFRKSTVSVPEKPEPVALRKEQGLQSHRLYHGYIIDPQERRVIDEVLLAWMQAPHTYTGEDVVEINSHSGTLLMQHILELVMQSGAVPAGPGEFSKRAFLNGRMDLTRAEAVNDLICAESQSALKIATTQLMGALGGRINRTRGVLVELLSEVYAGLDFGEQIESPGYPVAGVARLQAEVLDPLAELIKDYHKLRYLRNGIEIVIAGAPNVGKSTLMNRLAGSERCIVSAYPGTTRDIVEQQLMLQGLAVRLSDTAGLHESDDPIESIGVKKAWQKIKEADLVLALVDASRAFNEGDAGLFKSIDSCGIRALRVINKIDSERPDFRKSLANCGKPLPCIEISALSGHNIELLKSEIVNQIIGGKIPDAAEKIVPNLRHKHALEEALAACQKAFDGMQNQRWMELVADELETALGYLGEITGEKYSEEVIEQIFSGFCVGK